MSRTREDILMDIEDFTKRAEYCANYMEKHNKWVEELKQELKQFDKENK